MFSQMDIVEMDTVFNKKINFKMFIFGPSTHMEISTDIVCYTRKKKKSDLLQETQY